MRARAAKCPRKGRLILWLLLSLFGVATNPARAEPSATRDNFGGLGMIDMPSARMGPDGDLAVEASFLRNTQHYNFAFQIMPWLETSFRYSGLAHFDPAFPVYWDRSFAVKVRLWDEDGLLPALAIGVNDLVGTGIYSGEYIVASKQVGSFDFSLGLGWGRLGSTALLKNPLTSLSRSFDSRPTLTSPGGTNFNVFLHGRNVGIFGGTVWHTPIDRLSLIAEYSSDRYTLESTNGAFRPRNQLNFGAEYQVTDYMTLGLNWLYGSTIGGRVSFQLDPTQPQYSAKLNPPPIEVKTRPAEDQQRALLALLSQKKTKNTPRRRKSADTAKFVDALWQMDFDVMGVEGNTLVLTSNGDIGQRCIIAAQLAQSFDQNIRNIVIKGNSRKASQCTTAGALSAAYQVSLADNRDLIPISTPERENLTRVINAAANGTQAALSTIRTDARKQKIAIEALSITEGDAIIYYTNSHYFSEADALDRLVRILMQDAPAEIERFRLIAVVHGVPQQEFDILRGPEERKYAQTEKLNLFDDTSTTVTPPSMQNPVLAEAERHSYPRFSWDAYPQLRQELFDPDNPFAIDLTLAVNGMAEVLPGLSINGEIETNIFDNFNMTRASNSSLPHVRSDFLKYFARGKTGIGLLDAEYRFRMAPSVFAKVKAGYLENMFAGGGGEILWRPEGQRWALGADAYEVWQRGFDRRFDIQRYHTFSGHISLYYTSPWHDLNFMLSAGQYLAGDRGLTFQVTRRFSTGVEIGAFFTKTNVSSQQFGEGSFDKGIIVRIPLGWALPIETQGQWGIDLRPVQRDGGQFLENATTLFDETRRSSEPEIHNTLAQ